MTRFPGWSVQAHCQQEQKRQRPLALEHLRMLKEKSDNFRKRDFLKSVISSSLLSEERIRLLGFVSGLKVTLDLPGVAGKYVH